MTESLLQVSNLTVSYRRSDVPKSRSGEAAFSSSRRLVAVRDVSLTVAPGQILGLVGESGSGKSTLVKAIAGMISPDTGTVMLCGRDITAANGRQQCDLYRDVQMVFQSPRESFDPRRTLGYSAMEGLRNAGVSRAEARKRTAALFDHCGLDASLMDRYPAEVSGGQCQRVAIARAMALRPKLLICDEPTSALDTLAQAQVVRLICELRDETDMGVIFVCHDLALAQRLCDDVAVMRAGEIVEHGPAREVIEHPRHPYTRELIQSARAVSL